MAQPPKGGLVRGHDKPIHGGCAIYFPGGVDFWYESFLRNFWYQHDLPSKLNCCFIVGDSSLLSPSEIAISSLQLPMKLPKSSYTSKTSHFKTPTLALPKSRIKKSANPTLSTTDIRTNAAHVSGFPDGRRLQRRIQHLKGRIVAYGICLGGGSRWRRRLGWKKLQVEQTTGVVLDVEIAWYLYVYIYIYICLSTTYTSWFEEIFRMVVRDISPFSIRTPVKFRHSSQPGFPVLQPSSPWNSGLFGELGAKVQLTGKCRFWLSEMLG